jgi:ribosomal protein S18 acetylase RimI-like enzyme
VAHGIRRAKPSDLPAIQELELACFEEYRQASAASLKRSLSSPHQSVWVIDAPDRKSLWSLLVLWHFPHRLRVYDVCTHPDARGHGHGRDLMHHAEALARKAGCDWMTLEAEEQDPRLVGWYESQGYQVVDRLKDFYHKGCGAVRMTKRL